MGCMISETRRPAGHRSRPQRRCPRTPETGGIVDWTTPPDGALCGRATGLAPAPDRHSVVRRGAPFLPVTGVEGTGGGFRVTATASVGHRAKLNPEVAQGWANIH